MTPEQIQALRAVPLGDKPNRLALAFAMESVKQMDVCQELQISEARMSLLVNGKYRKVSVDEAGRIARYFGCAIEDLLGARLMTCPTCTTPGMCRHAVYSGDVHKGTDQSSLQIAVFGQDAPYRLRLSATSRFSHASEPRNDARSSSTVVIAADSSSASCVSDSQRSLSAA
jgi:DNA-binding Xre family transcriptional regulator